MNEEDRKWLKLFRYLDKRFEETNGHLSRFETKFDKVQNSIDGLAKRVADDDVERLAQDHQLARHERWFKQIGGQLGADLQ